MSQNEKERDVFPALGKAVFNDPEAFIHWYLEEDGYGWLSTGDNYSRLISPRETMLGKMVPNHRDIYYRTSTSEYRIKGNTELFRTITGYIERFGGRFDLLLYEPEMSVIQYGSQRFLVPTRFITVTLFPDYSEKTLGELNRMLLPGDSEISEGEKPGAVVGHNKLSVSGVKAERMKQNGLIQEAQKEIDAVTAELNRKIEALRAEARIEMQKIGRMKLGLQVKVEELTTKIFMLDTVIYSVECYLGDAVDFIQLRAGAAAPDDAALVVHQKLRYLDEDLPILLSIYGFRFEGSEMFEEALKNRDDLMEYFCPGDKCISFVRVSKTAKSFSLNENDMLAQYDIIHGKTIGILLRNGENLYFGWTEEARIMLPDGNVFYTPKVIETDPTNPDSGPKEVQYLGALYTDEQFSAMTPEEQQEILDKDQITYYIHQRDFEKRKVLAKVHIFSILQGLLDKAEIVSIPEKVHLLNTNAAGSKYLIFSNADGWIEDNRYGDFSGILERFEKNHKAGDVILSTIHLNDGHYIHSGYNVEFRRSTDGSSRTHDCHIGDGEFHKINLVTDGEDSNGWPRNGGASYFVSLEKKYSDAAARSNFEVYEDEFINMTFLNSEWLHYAILNKKLGQFTIHGSVVSYAHAVRYMKLAYEHLKKRESEELAMLCECLPDLAERFPVWMVSLSDWKEQHNVRRITPYQAKRFVKWLLSTEKVG